MKRFTVFLIVCIYLISPFTLAQHLRLNGTGTIRISCSGVNTELPVSVEILHSFPAFGYDEQWDTLSAARRTVWLSCPVRAAQQVFINIGSKRLNVFLAPSDTILININSPAFNPAYTIEGRNKEIQNYYLAKTAKFPVSPGQQVMNAGVGDAGLHEVKALADSLFKLETSFFNEYAKALPEWFKRYETDAIRYSDAYIRLYAYHYWQDVKRQAAKTPVTYFNFLQTIPARNAAALYDYNYLFFLREYVRFKSPQKIPGKSSQNSILADYRMHVALLGRRIGEFFTLFTVSETLNDDPQQVEKELAGLPVLQSHSFLVPYLQESASQRISFLSAGKSSPNFILSDTRDSLISLSQFKGQVVYLSFWFAGCKGCIEEFPYENELVEKLKGNPVQIISICTRTSPGKWMDKIREYGLKTLNLYANAEWGSTLEKKFGINVYPQYVLIGPGGEIIENFTNRPRNGAYEKIMQVLAVTGY